MRKPTQDDIESAQRGLRMVGMSIADLRELIAEHMDFRRKDNFASQVIVDAAQQIYAAKRRAGARENPRARKRNPSGVRIVYNRLLSGWYIVRGPHQTPLGGRFDSKEQAQQHLIDQQNARDARVSYTRRNPSQRIRSTRRRAVLGQKRLRGRARVSMQGGTLGDANYFTVQVKRSAAWTTLAGFPRGEFGKARATEYGKLLARRYPRQKFRVFWPTSKSKNPRLSAPSYNGGASQTFRKIAYAAGRDAGNRSMRAAGRTRWSKKDFSVAAKEFERLTRKKNPAPLTSRVNGAQINRAARLFTAFTGHRVTKMRHVPLPQVKVGLAIGPVLELAYTTTRDGKRENYLHKFRHGARPLLAASQDGRTLLMLSGAYRFTPRGIVDTPRR